MSTISRRDLFKFCLLYTSSRTEVTVEDLEDYPRYAFEQGANNSFFYSEEPLAELPHKKCISVSDRGTLSNLLAHHDGYTISTGVLSSEMYTGIASVPLQTKELMRVGDVYKKQAVLLSERDLPSRWGANFLSGGTDSAAMIRKQELADRCDEIARTYKLSAREEEVLLLLAQRKTVGIIERELLIANGTAKAHVRHIYQKLGIRTRQELFDLLGLDGRETGPQD